MKHLVKYVIMLCLFISVIITFSCEIEDTVDPEYKDYFIKYYGGDGNQEAKDFLVQEDGTVIMVGTSYEVIGNQPISKVYVVKADQQGNVIWSKKWGGNKNEIAQDIELIRGGIHVGSYLMLSNVIKNEADSTMIKVLRFDSDGNKIDSIEYDRYKTQFAHSITAVSDGGFIFTGNSKDTTAFKENSADLAEFEDKEDLIIVRYDQNLGIYNPEWISFGGEELVMGVKVIELTLTQFYFAGSSNSSRAGGGIPQTNFWYAPLSGSGSFNSEFFVGTPSDNENLSGIARNGNTYLSIGTKVNASINRIYVSGVDKPFFPPPNPLPEGFIIGPDQGEGVGVSVAEGNNFWIVGNEIKGGGRDIWVQKVAYHNGSIAEDISMSFGGANNDDTGSAIAVASNGDLLILGTMELVNQKKMALIKVRPNGSF